MTNYNALYIRNLNFQAEEWELEELFEKYGEIRSIVLQRDQDTGLPRGAAFVNFKDDGPA